MLRKGLENIPFRLTLRHYMYYTGNYIQDCILESKSYHSVQSRSGGLLYSEDQPSLTVKGLLYCDAGNEHRAFFQVLFYHLEEQEQAGSH